MKKSLLLGLILSLCGGKTFADQVEPTYKIIEDTLIVLKGTTGEMADDEPWLNEAKNTVKYLIVENGITTIPSSSFRDLIKLEKVSLPSTITTIGSRAFQGCTNLQNIVMPKNLKTLKTYVFADCPNLKNVYFTGLPLNEFYSFENRNNVNIYVPIESLYKYRLLMEAESQLNMVLPMLTKPKGANIHTTKLRTFSDSDINYNLDSIMVLRPDGSTETASNVNAYYASKSDDNSITLNPTTGILTSKQGIIFSFEGNDDEFYPLTKTESNTDKNIKANLLVGTGNDTIVANSNIWGLYSDTEFRRYSGGAIPRYKAYIESSSNAKFYNLNIIFNEETTDINAVDLESLDNNTEAYNLSGQKIDNNYKGIIIKNGRKYIQK